MKLSTIWTLRGMPLRERLHRTSEWGALWVAHRLPRRIAYWSFIDTVGRNLRPNEVVPRVTCLQILIRIDPE